MTAAPAPIARRTVFALVAAGFLGVGIVGYLAWPKLPAAVQCADPAAAQNVGTQTQVPTNPVMPKAPPVFTSQTASAQEQYQDVRATVAANHARQVSAHRASFIAEGKLTPEQVGEYDHLIAAGNDVFRDQVVPAIDAALAAPNDPALQQHAKKVMQDIVVGLDMKLLAMNPGTDNRMANVLEYENMGKFRQFVIAFAPPTAHGGKLDNVRAALAK